MDAHFALQITKGILPFDEDIGAFDARFLAADIVQDLIAEAPALGPVGIHPVQHAGPVLGLGAAGPGVEGHDGVVFIIFPFEQGGEFFFLQHGLEFVVILLHFLVQAFLALLQSHVDQLQGVVIQALQLFIAGGFVLQLLDPLQHLLGLLWLIPEARGRGLLFQLGSFLGAILQIQRSPQLHQLRLYIDQIGTQFF